MDLYQEKRLDWNERSHNGDGEANDEGADPKELEEKVAELCNQLKTTHDTIRAKYWDYILLKFQLKLAQNETDHAPNSDQNSNEEWTKTK